MKKYIVRQESELQDVAKQILPYLKGQRLVCFDGEMGAGKTTFIKVLCQEMGVEDAMSSPTFAIINEYRDKNDDPIYHFDFYRVEDLREALDIGVDEYFYSGNLCLIEWPERIKDLIPKSHLKISIKLVEENSREIIVEPNDR